MEKEKMIMRKLKEREAGITLTLIKKQIVSALKYVSPENAQRCIIAYEPIWAIGTGKSATKEDAQNCCAIVRDQVRVMYGDEAAENVRVQYGGASLKADSFIEIIEKTK